MPFVTTKIDLLDVVPHLKSKGYGFHQDRKYEVQLNVPSKERFRKLDGAPYRDLLRGLSKQEVDIVLTKAQTALEAAMWLERLSLGESMSVQDSDMEPGGGKVVGLTAEQIAQIIDSRVRMRVSEELQGPMAEISAIREDIGNLMSSLQKQEDEATTPKKRAQKTRKRDPNSPEVDAALKEIGLPLELPPIED